MKELLLKQLVSRETIEKASTNNETINVSGTILEQPIKGFLSFTGTGKVNDRGWSGYFTSENGDEYYASSHKWENNQCAIIDLF